MQTKITVGMKTKNNIILTKNKSMKTVLKSHRATLDFDKHFVVNSITADGFNFAEDLELMKRWGWKRKRSGDGLV